MTVHDAAITTLRDAPLPAILAAAVSPACPSSWRPPGVALAALDMTAANPTAQSISADQFVAMPDERPSVLKQVGAILGRMPNPQDRDHVRAGDPVHNEVGGHDHQLSRAGLAPRSATTGKYHQAVTGE